MDWVNNSYRQTGFLKKERKEYPQRTPFPYAVLPDFLKEEKAKQVADALLSEQFFEKRADLFRFYQTNNLLLSKNPIVKGFVDQLQSKEFLQWVNTITQKRVRKISLFGSLYEDSHYLLPHDDRLENRKVAFIYYLSDLKKDQGGKLQLFGSKKNKPIKVEKEIMPTFNTFAFFSVSPTSFHQVEEVIRGQRLSLTGWFHG